MLACEPGLLLNRSTQAERMLDELSRVQMYECQRAVAYVQTSAPALASLLNMWVRRVRGSLLPREIVEESCWKDAVSGRTQFTVRRQAERVSLCSRVREAIELLLWRRDHWRTASALPMNSHTGLPPNGSSGALAPAGHSRPDR